MAGERHRPVDLSVAVELAEEDGQERRRRRHRDVALHGDHGRHAGAGHARSEGGEGAVVRGPRLGVTGAGALAGHQHDEAREAVQPAEVVDEAASADELDTAVVLLQQQLRLAVVDEAVADEVQDVAAVLQRLGEHRERGRTGRALGVGQHRRRRDRTEAGAGSLQLVRHVDGVDGLAAVGVVAARVGDDDRRRRARRATAAARAASRCWRGTRDSTMFSLVARGRPSRVCSVSQRTSCSSPHARRQQQPQAQDHPVGGGDGERLVERRGDVRVGEQALAEQPAVGIGVELGLAELGQVDAEGVLLVEDDLRRAAWLVEAQLDRPPLEVTEEPELEIGVRGHGPRAAGERNDVASLTAGSPTMVKARASLRAVHVAASPSSSGSLPPATSSSSARRSAASSA